MNGGLGSYIKQRRAELGMSQADLTVASGVSKSHLSQIELGKIALPNADLRRRLAAALKVSHLDLLIAAGEISADELTELGKTGQVALSETQESMIELVKRIDWDSDESEFAVLVLNRMFGKAP
jgi:transcriptional regulator with XRE-family HTH domain